MLNIQAFTFNPYGERCYLVWDGTLEAAVIDPGCDGPSEGEALTRFIADKGLDVKAVWLTHGHFDHVCGVQFLPGVPVFMNPADNKIAAFADAAASVSGFKATIPEFEASAMEGGTIGEDGEVSGGDVLTFGNTSFHVIATPGHTPGSVCFYDPADKVLFSGDTLFAGSIGRTDLPLGDYDTLIVSLMDGIMGLPGDVEVFPGHGPATDIAAERTHNPFLQPFNEPFSDTGEDGMA